jgi:hypothetical protein
VADGGGVFVNEEGRAVANHNVLIDLIFGIPVTAKDRRERSLNRVGKSIEESSLANEQDFETGLNLKGED